MPPAKPFHTITRAAIASDQAIYLRGLSCILANIPQVSLVGEAHSPLEALELCQICTPDLIFLDFKNILDQGKEAVQKIQQHWPDTQIILMLRPDDELQFSVEIESQAVFSFSRDLSEDELKAALIQILEGCNPAGQAVQALQLEAEDVASFQAAPLLSAPRDSNTLTHELLMAGKIQEDILPEQAPTLAGWEISARLLPARETSGDFYDFIPLTQNKWGIAIADVVDKGMGAALFMALTSTLLRNYAARFPTLPALTLNAVNERILTDTRGGMFVTSFFGILEPLTGRFIYANGGHPPAYMVNNRRNRETLETLRATGMALGVSERAQWKQKAIRINPGDFLVLYTDGVTEAQNSRGDFFGSERLADLLISLGPVSAFDVQEAIIREVYRFTGSAGPQDDLALIVIRRKG